jgi:alpha-beta hydrolase superfamily lysophospholipase
MQAIGRKLRVLYAAGLSLLNACAQQHQLVHERYPAWGEEILIDVPQRKTPLHLRLMMPPKPDDAPACLLIVHGMNEYIGRYKAIAAHFAQRFIVAGVDLYGHGLSNPTFLSADRAIGSGRQPVDVADAYLMQSKLRTLKPMFDDLDQALRYLIERCDTMANSSAPRPLFILSHSLGSLVSALYLLAPHPAGSPHDRVEGIVFSGPAFSVTEVPGWRGWFQNPFVKFSFHTHEHFLTPHDEPLPLMLLNQAIALVAVPMHDGVIELLSLPGLRRLFAPTTPEWVVDYLTDWEEEKARHRADPYIIRRSVLRYVLSVEQAIVRFRRNMDRFRTPYLLIYSAHDPITPAWGVHDFAAVTLQSHPDNELIALPDKQHHEQLFSAPPLDQWLLQEVDRWLDRRLQKERYRPAEGRRD